jgi:drug/metabolite transporter (DMT)-like permease
VKPWPVLLIASAAGALPLLGTALMLGESILPQSWWPVIILSISSQLVGQGLLVYAMGHLSPVVVGLCFLTQPIASAAIGWAVYDEALGLGDGLGALLVCAALVLIRLPDRRLASVPVEGQ